MLPALRKVTGIRWSVCAFVRLSGSRTSISKLPLAVYMFLEHSSGIGHS